MATWHQMRNLVQLWHETQYAVVIDPPNECRAVMLFATRAEAEAYIARGNVQHAYILDPRPKTSGQ